MSDEVCQWRSQPQPVPVSPAIARLLQTLQSKKMESCSVLSLALMDMPAEINAAPAASAVDS